jgi:hypothetical protein
VEAMKAEFDINEISSVTGVQQDEVKRIIDSMYGTENMFVKANQEILNATQIIIDNDVKRKISPDVTYSKIISVLATCVLNICPVGSNVVERQKIILDITSTILHSLKGMEEIDEYLNKKKR